MPAPNVAYQSFAATRKAQHRDGLAPQTTPIGAIGRQKLPIPGCFHAHADLTERVDFAVRLVPDSAPQVHRAAGRV